jgi:hypothetical protein
MPWGYDDFLNYLQNISCHHPGFLPQRREEIVNYRYVPIVGVHGVEEVALSKQLEFLYQRPSLVQGQFVRYGSQRRIVMKYDLGNRELSIEETDYNKFDDPVFEFPVNGHMEAGDPELFFRIFLAIPRVEGMNLNAKYETQKIEILEKIQRIILDRQYTSWSRIPLDIQDHIFDLVRHW